jgi:hypothetical protein
LRLRGFQGGRGLLRRAPVGTKKDDPADDSRQRADHDHGIEPDYSDRHRQYQYSAGGRESFCNQDDLSTALDNLGKPLDLSLECQDLFANIAIVHVKLLSRCLS